jgi:hypothetical protein
MIPVLLTCLSIKAPDWRAYCQRKCERIHNKAIREICETERDHKKGRRWLTEKDVH